jgi:hypothetical protein
MRHVNPQKTKGVQSVSPLFISNNSHEVIFQTKSFLHRIMGASRTVYSRALMRTTTLDTKNKEPFRLLHRGIHSDSSGCRTAEHVLYCRSLCDHMFTHDFRDVVQFHAC